MKLLFVLIFLFLTSCNTNVAGTSSDVDIITGILVTTAQTKVPNAKVSLYSSDKKDTTAVATTRTNKDGVYQFKGVGDGTFYFQVISEDMTLVGLRMNIVHSRDTYTNLNVDSLFAPGAISGKVILAKEDDDNITNTKICIPGTSYGATCNSMGEFTISGIPAGTGYLLKYYSLGHEDVFTPDTITVISGKKTVLPPVLLRVNNKPLGVTATYNRQSNTVKISWNKSTRTDIAGYIVCRKDARSSWFPLPLDTTKLCLDTFYIDTISPDKFSKDDSIPFQYNIKWKDTAEEESKLSQKIIVTVYSPFDSLTRLSVNFLLPDGMTSYQSGDSAKISWKSSSNVTNVELDYSIDDGNSWFTVKDTYTNIGQYQMLIPQVSSDSCRIRIIPNSDSAQSVVSSRFSIKAIPGKNMLANGDFSEGLGKAWELYQWGNGKASMNINPAGQCVIALGAVPDSTWYVGIQQQKILLQTGYMYRITFDAKSTINKHRIPMVIGQTHFPWKTYACQDAILDTTMQSYLVQLYMDDPSDLEGMFGFFPATAEGTVTIDNFKMVREEHPLPD